jgi:hypothetical protein
MAEFPEGHSAQFWSSATHSNLSTHAWMLSTDNSYGFLFGKTDFNYTRGNCVRGGPVIAGTASFTAFTDSGGADPVVTDAVTGLMWQLNFASGQNWAQALATCENSTYGGHGDWRLPNAFELLSLVNYAKYNPATDFPGMPAQFFWASTTVPDRDSQPRAKLVGFSDGRFVSDLKTASYNARCVRGGP